MNPLPWHEAHFERLIGDQARMPHALLLHGPEGIGKSRFAASLAQGLLCESAGRSRPCQACAACGWFGSGNHPDFRLLEPARPEENEQGEQQSASKARVRIVIEQIRQLSDFINVSSHRGGPKVILVQPAEALNMNAANALLKSLEEPPAGTFFLLVTHRLHFLPPTLRSRCRHIALPVPEANSAAAWLRAQGATQPEVALAHTGNAPLLAHELAQRDYWPQRDLFLSQVAVTRFDPLAAAEEIGDLALRDVVTWLQKWTFDLIFQHCLGKVHYNPDRASAIAALSGNIEPLRMLRFHRELLNLQRVMDHPLNPRLLIEQILLGYGIAMNSASADHA